MTNAADLYDLLRKIRYDATAIQAKLTDAFAMLDALHIEDVPAVTCPSCGVPVRGPRTLAEHLHVSHNGPTPEHWLAADRLIDGAAVEGEPSRAQASQETPENGGRAG